MSIDIQPYALVYVFLLIYIYIYIYIPCLLNQIRLNLYICIYRLMHFQTTTFIFNAVKHRFWPVLFVIAT